jgi:uncharacterized protein DUF5372
MKNIFLLGDHNAFSVTHRELDAAIKLLPNGVTARWVGTDTPDAMRTSQADAVWAVSGSRVMYVRADGRTRSLPVGWTSIAPEDRFVSVAAGRAPFRLEDLLALTALLRDIGPRRAREGDARVK